MYMAKPASVAKALH